MHKFLWACLLCFLSGLAFASHKHTFPTPESLNSSKQLLVVTTSNWNTVDGQLQRYERRNYHSVWEPVGTPIPIVVGKNGLGWNPKFKQHYHLSGPIKQEGDSRAPAGIFPIGPAFGFAPGYIKNIKLPYIQLMATSVCVDDPKSKFYNKIVNSTKIKHPDWQSGEQMRQLPEYLWGMSIDYNTEKPTPNAGSCIFLHIWKQPNQGTVGCVAMAEPNVEQLITWINPRGKPLIVMLPQAEYKILEKTWHLPNA